MRIGVNALYLIPGGVGGTEIYLRSLLDAMVRIAPEHSYVAFTNRETGRELGTGIEIAAQPIYAANRPVRILWEQKLLPLAVLRRRIDVLFNPGFTAPLAAPCPQVTVFHDLQHKRHPEHFRWFDLPAWRVLLFLSACTADRLIAVSEQTKADLLRYYPVRAAKIDVIPHGVDERLFHLHREPRQFVLCVSTLHPHKNIERLVRVFARFRATHPGWTLVLAGMRGFHAEAIERLIAQLNLTEAVRVTGWIAREELYDLYRTAGAFIYPSTFEGFGMPVLEALAARIPTACSNIPPLRQFPALQFDPLDEAAMMRALERLVSEPPPPSDVRRYTWEATAEATLRVLVSSRGGAAL